MAAVAGDRSSAPARVRVVVAPVNDEPPRVANSSSLRLWRGGSATITSANLGKVKLSKTIKNHPLNLGHQSLNVFLFLF